MKNASWKGRVNRRAPASAQRSRHKLWLEPLEDRCQPSVSGFRPITEVGNNVAHPTQATAGMDLLRLSPVAYADGISSPSLPNNPGTRVLSDQLNNQADAAGNDIQTVNQANLSDFGYAFGQFMDHDMDLTPTTSGELFNILADTNDPSKMATQTFVRSSFDPHTGTSTSNPRQQTNAVTSYLDLSQVYGSTQVVADALRTFQGGLLKTSDNGQLLPLDATIAQGGLFTQAQVTALNMANASQAIPTQDLFAAGDVRANENVELTALQTLFVLNHNMLATQLATMNSQQFGFTSWTDENLYQEARKLNIAQYQNIIYTQYLPDLLGPNFAPQYTGYNPNVNSSIATEFSTVAFRFGHSLLSNFIQRQDNNGNNIATNAQGAPIVLSSDFFVPTVINPSGATDPFSGYTTSGINAILKGDADGDAQAMDNLFINEVRNLLFANGAAVDNGQDLVARDVQRARDDGIGTYNQVREAFGLAPVTSFAQITSNPQLQQELQNAYGSVNNIDPFEGGVFENLATGSSTGTLFSTILSNQFARLENGDRYFYRNETFTTAEEALLDQGGSLAKIIEANTNVTNLQADVFKFTAAISGTVFLDLGNGATRTPGSLGLPGFTVELEDTSGDILATTHTNAFGQYTFTQQSGTSPNPEIASGVSATGDYQIVLVLPSFLTQATATPAPIHISRGGIDVDSVNFGVNFNFNGASGLAFLLNGSGSLVAAGTTNSQGQANFGGQNVNVTSTDTEVTLVLHPNDSANPATLTITNAGTTKTVQFGTDFTISDSSLAYSSFEELVDVMQALDKA